MALKAWAYWLTNSIGLLSDALESSVNLLAALIAVYALTVAAKPPDEKHHFGHGKAEYFSSAIEGLLVLIAAALIILSSLDHLQAPHPLQQLDWGLAVAAAASLINLLTARALKSAGRRFRSIALEADAAHLMSDVWTSVGVAAGLGLAWLTGEYILDPIIALLVATHIVWSGLTLIYRSVHGLLERPCRRRTTPAFCGCWRNIALATASTSMTCARANREPIASSACTCWCRAIYRSKRPTTWPTVSRRTSRRRCRAPLYPPISNRWTTRRHITRPAPCRQNRRSAPAKRRRRRHGATAAANGL